MRNYLRNYNYKRFFHITLGLIFYFINSSHPVEFKELNKENLKEENTSPPVFDFKTLCESCKNKPEKEVENKKSSKPERRPKYVYLKSFINFCYNRLHIIYILSKIIGKNQEQYF